MSTRNHRWGETLAPPVPDAAINVEVIDRCGRLERAKHSILRWLAYFITDLHPFRSGDQMSTVKLTLRPPPNVEFVQGYPGIPPGAPDRPQAAVNGTIEVRVGAQGCKAKWVRIELKKVETLPGGGQAGTFYDFVGQSPMNLWQSTEEYSMLPTQDFPFFIRIPESIPPSIALEKGAGIKYELLGSVCLKGKKGFLRRGKPIIQSTQTTIILDKHELHSTWPVYCQPESRTHAQDGVTLIVDRTHTCYGPGDRVSVMATLKSDNLHTVILRAFEFTLKETVIFRGGPYATGKKGAPQVRTNTIGEQKVPVNVTIYGGTHHKAELSCIIPLNHTTTTINSARHIDITYVINVKALMGTGTHLLMDLPVIVSNWPRNVSIEAVRRIGTTPSLSLSPPSNTPTAANNRVLQPTSENGGPYPSHQVPERISQHGDQSSDFGPTSVSSPGKYNTTPGGYTKPLLDDFGYGRPDVNSSATTTTRPNASYSDNIPAELRPGAGRQPVATNSRNRLTITNIGDSEHELNEIAASAARPARSQWLPAEEEKRRLYEKATADVARVQGTSARLSPPLSQSPPASPTKTNPSIKEATTPPHNGDWLTAEQEKTRLYDQARATASRTQGAAAQSFGTYSPSAAQTTSSSRPSQSKTTADPVASGSHLKASSISQPASTLPTVSAGAALYQHALSSMNRSPPEQTLPSPPPSRGRISPPIKSIPAYPSAEEEKAALKRYHEAKVAVERTQGIQNPPMAYDSLYPNNLTRSASYSVSSTSSMLPSASQPGNALSEKERLRRAYEAQDAAALSQQTPAYSSPPTTYSSPGFTSSGSSNALSEKEMLRRKYEAQDAAALGNSSGPPPQPPPRRPSLSHDVRSPPARVVAGGSHILSAVEEKARLKAHYEAEEQNSRLNGTPSPPLPPSFGHQPIEYSATAETRSPTPPPPPLMPRPPAVYIQETQAEDARIRDSDDNLIAPLNGNGLELRSYSPFNANGKSVPPGPPPPLPPKSFD